MYGQPAVAGPNLYCQEYPTKLVSLRDGYYLHGLVVGRYVRSLVDGSIEWVLVDCNNYDFLYGN